MGKEGGGGEEGGEEGGKEEMGRGERGGGRGKEENYMRESYTANKTKASLLTGTWCMYEQCLTYTCSNFNLTSKGTKVKTGNTSVTVSQRHWFLSHYFNHILP